MRQRYTHQISDMRRERIHAMIERQRASACSYSLTPAPAHTFTQHEMSRRERRNTWSVAMSPRDMWERDSDAQRYCTGCGGCTVEESRRGREGSSNPVSIGVSSAEFAGRQLTELPRTRGVTFRGAHLTPQSALARDKTSVPSARAMGRSIVHKGVSPAERRATPPKNM